MHSTLLASRKICCEIEIGWGCARSWLFFVRQDVRVEIVVQLMKISLGVKQGLRPWAEWHLEINSFYYVSASLPSDWCLVCASLRFASNYSSTLSLSTLKRCSQIKHQFYHFVMLTLSHVWRRDEILLRFWDYLPSALTDISNVFNIDWFPEVLCRRLEYDVWSPNSPSDQM